MSAQTPPPTDPPGAMPKLKSLQVLAGTGIGVVLYLAASVLAIWLSIRVFDSESNNRAEGLPQVIALFVPLICGIGAAWYFAVRKRAAVPLALILGSFLVSTVAW